ncbi:MAG: DUF3570 domain-containing protein [Campylobacterota bacterium]|nr:DUF3570 domain-containing protein [Campylobacterota bacterium]
MQLDHKLSIAAASVLLSSSLYAQDYVRVNVMNYSENDDRVTVTAPSVEINKELGLDYTLNGVFVSDSVSGATPVYSDTTSGASAYHRGTVLDISNIKKENIEFDEQRAYGSLSVTKRVRNRDEITALYSKSYESDYDSNTLGFGYMIWADESKNRSYNFDLSYQFNEILIKDCTGNHICSDADSISGASKKEDATMISTQVGITQYIDERSLAKVSVFYANEDGYLSNPYYNVIRNTNQVEAENRPDTRTAYGFNLKYIRSFSDDLSSNFAYKFYSDDWDINSHTLDINNYYELNDKFTVGFGIRYYGQSKAEFYSKSTTYFTNEEFASHDDRLSAFNAFTYKATLDYKYSDKISYNIGLNYYTQSTDLDAVYSSVGFKYNF